MINVSKTGNTKSFSEAQFSKNKKYIVLFSPDFKYKVDSFNLYIHTIMLKGLLGGVYHEFKTLKTINKVH